jgi:uncharacterized protein (UPF0332 family)
MIQGEDFLVVAQSLASGTTEAEWRTAVSRAYYAAFHVARRLLGDLGFQVPQGDQAHAYLWMRLGNCGEATISAAGPQLNRLRGDRNRADYDLHHDISDVDADFSVLEARKFLQTLTLATVQPVRSQITAAIRDYERNVLRNVTWQGP